MTGQLTPNVIEITTIVEHGSDFPWVSRYFARDSVAVRGGTYYDGIATSVHNWWNANVRGGVTPSYALKQIKIRDLNAFPYAEKVYPVNEVGTSPGTDGPASACAVIVWVPDAPSPSTRAFHTYHSGLVDLASDAVKLTAAEQANLRADYAALPVALNEPPHAATAQVVVSKFHGMHLEGPDSLGRVRRVPTLRPQGISQTLSDVLCELDLGTQSRRKIKRNRV